MDFLTSALQLLVAYGSLALLIWAFVDATRFTQADYKEVDKMGRKFWLIAMGTAIVLLVWLGSWRPDEPFGPRSVTWLAGLILIGIYFYDLRPRLKRARWERTSPANRKRPKPKAPRRRKNRSLLGR